MLTALHCLLTLGVSIVIAIVRTVRSTTRRSGICPVLIIIILVNYLRPIKWATGQQVTWLVLPAYWRMNLCPEFFATIPRDMLPGMLNLLRAGWQRVGTIDLIVKARTPAFGLIGIRMVIIGIQLQTWMQVIVNRCIGKIITKDISLVASWLYRMVVAQTWVTCRRYIIPISRRRPPGLHKPYKRKRKERQTRNETIISHAQLYEPLSPTTNRYSSMASFRLIRCMGKLHRHWLVVKPMPTPFVPGHDPRRQEEKRETRKHPKVIPSPYLDFLTQAPMTIIPVARMSRRRSLLKLSGW